LLHLAICDDNAIVIEQIETFIDRMGKKRIEYDIFYSAEELYCYKHLGNEYDMYLLDIEMGGMTGLNLAKKLREEKSNALIVFLTNHTQYVYDVFEVFTFDFIIKPITYEKFNGLILKAEKYLKTIGNKFVFSYRKNTYSLPYNMINYIEKMGRKAFIYDTEGNIYQSNMTLTEIWEQLDEKVFAKIHSSVIVNLAQVTGIVNDEVQLKSKVKLFISRNYRQKVKQQHLQYLKEMLN